MRHLLVDLRRQQFTLRDTFQNTVYRHTQAIPQIDDSIALCPMPLAFETEIQVYPLGLFTEEKLSQQIFQAEPDFENITENDYKNINDFYWAKKTEPKTNFYIDFRELEHVYNLFLLLFDLEDSAAVASANAFTESTTEYLLKTFQFYLDLAQLSEVHREIVDLKIRRVKNQQIADYINEKYDKSYTANYISTIFRQKIIKQINESAAFHEEIVGNIFFPENFKTCTCCGKLLLKDPKNFVRKTRSRDGYSTRCKKCDKESRDRKKIK